MLGRSCPSMSPRGGDGRDDDVDALELRDEAGHVEQGALDVGRARRRAPPGTERATDTTVWPRLHRLGDDVAAGVAGSSDDGDASHGASFRRVPAEASAAAAGFIPADRDHVLRRARTVETW